MSQIIDGWIVLLSFRGTSLRNYVHRTRVKARQHAGMINKNEGKYGIKATVRKCRVEVFGK
jgi:hypothetical protein